MDVTILAALGAALASLCVAVYLRRNRSSEGQGFSCQVGDQVITGRFQVLGDKVQVTYGERTRSAPLQTQRPLHVAERLLAELAAQD